MPAVLVAAVALPLLTAPVLVLAAVADLLSAPRRWAATRLAAFTLCWIVFEAIGVVLAGALWLRHGAGTRLHSAASRRSHQRLQRWWISNLTRTAQALLGLRYEVTGEDALRPGPVVVLSRHASPLDSLISAAVLTARHHLAVRYVLRRELAWDPCLDLVGHRLPNHFVDRSGVSTEGEVAAVGALADGMGSDDALVIFPEGAHATDRRRERAVARLEATRPDVAERARRLRHLLPPRFGGTLAALARGHDVVVMAHVGFEELSRPVAAWRRVPLPPVQVRLERFAAGGVPDRPDEAERWLLDRWDEVDRWVHERLADRAGS